MIRLLIERYCRIRSRILRGLSRIITMCWSEQTRYSSCGYHICQTYRCPFQQDSYSSESGWLPECMMQDVQPAKEEHVLCGRCEAIVSFDLFSPAYLGRDRRFEDDNIDERQTHQFYAVTSLMACVGEDSTSDSTSSSSTDNKSFLMPTTPTRFQNSSSA
jgi:hypothetical protein